jgi:hypothetical protein
MVGAAMFVAAVFSGFLAILALLWRVIMWGFRL